MAVLRGYFQGLNTMVPTAISQIIEQLVNAVVSIVGASILFGIGTRAGEKAGEELLGPAYGAAGSTIGTVSGAAAGLLFLIFVFWLYKAISETAETGSDQRKRKLFSYSEDTCFYSCAGYTEYGGLQYQSDS